MAEIEAEKRKKERLREEERESSVGWWGWASSWVTGADSAVAYGEEEPIVPSGK